ncbi:hypothetical protein COLO4_34468 [Corchorus olitorius]|uniref:Uncharacterized protein n=1 Tax=Corchorus olitorius TaxID=93759 RepID=A0A1R3GKP5_9ROSI|nr:hypothetical protein COLO4_34468 [Corchorus olitorius]
MEESSSSASAAEAGQSQRDEVLMISEGDMDQTSTCPGTEPEVCETESSESKPSLNKSDLLQAVEVVERDSLAIADSFSSLFASLRLALSELGAFKNLVK